MCAGLAAVAQTNPSGAARSGAGAAPGAARPANCGGPFKSVEQLPDSRMTFRFCAPNASTVTVTGDLPERVVLSRSAATDLFTGTTSRPAPAGTYRYLFRVDGVQTLDPQASEVAGGSTGFKGVFSVTGPAGDFQAFNPAIPHGVVHQVYYQSKSLGGVFRRMQIYTPPGYEADSRRYPVLYIRHAAGDDDTDWMTVGRAPWILDNLIAAGKATPMIIVSGAEPGNAGLPAPAPGAARGPGFTAGKATGTGAPTPGDRYGVDLFGDIIPYVESHYRTIADADHRAMAGLAAAVNDALPNPQTFHYIGLFSISGGGAAYEARVGEALGRGARDFKLVYFACGNADPLVTDHGDALLRTLDRFNVKYIRTMSGGGHTWNNWRDYLNAFAPLLFKGKVQPQSILS